METQRNENIINKQRIDGQALKRFIINGAHYLESRKAFVDSLNVFPVPDGDTGTNMSMTALAAAREVEGMDSTNAAEIAKAASGGSLRGARGNSGVILSQLFRGFAKGLGQCETIGVDEVTAALQSSVETAYKAVMKPREGTILTVARHMADKALEFSLDAEDLNSFFQQVLISGEEMLAKTIDMIPVLKQAGVVDAGAQGLLLLLRGRLEYKMEDEPAPLSKEQVREIDFHALAAVAHEDIKFGYCTEFFINLEDRAVPAEQKEEELKAYLDTMGDSIVCVSDEDFIKIHVHTNHPGTVLEKALTYGPLNNLKIENMRFQHTDATGVTSRVQQVAPATQTVAPFEMPVPEMKKDIGFVAVAAGEGFKELFMSIGADAVIEGGQTMNPSAEDIAEAIKNVNSDCVIVLPNNKNIILAAQQAVYLCEEKKVVVLNSKSIPQGITAMISFIPGESLEDNAACMEEALSTVKTGQITHAVRNTVVGDQEIKEGDYLCMLDGKIAMVTASLVEGAKALLDAMIDEDCEAVSIFRGIDGSEDDARELDQYISVKYPQVEIESLDGGQPVYYFILSAE